MTEEIDIQRQMMRMHGFAIHSSLLSEYPDDEEINTIVSVHPHHSDRVNTPRSSKCYHNGHSTLK